uniref:Gasdermin pore forming domain-containing protein n=1 Tax=Myripristis murdjan TaxID=586833 RepID=A0A667WGS9_9TELE
MFSKATANFIRQIDPEGSLIHVSRLPDSHKLVPMALVVKRNRFWFWQKPKYQPTAFTLSDLLLGDTLLVPVVSETDFLTYAGTFGDVIGGQVDAKAGVVSVTLEGRGSTKLQSSFGKLKIEKVDVRKLLQDSNDRLVNMNHVLVQQLEKRAEVLAVLHERIFTTSPCSVIETRQDQGTCGAMLGLTGKLRSTVAVSVKDSNVKMDSDVSVEIPPGTVIAYSLLELEIKKDGHFEPCLQPSTTGGFEADSGTSSPSHDSVGTFCEIDGFEWAEEMVLGGQPLSTLQNGVCLFSFSFTQHSFNQSLTDACLTHSSSQCFSWFLFVCERPVVRWKNFVSLFPFHTVAVIGEYVFLFLFFKKGEAL